MIDSSYSEADTGGPLEPSSRSDCLNIKFSEETGRSMINKISFKRLWIVNRKFMTEIFVFIYRTYRRINVGSELLTGGLQDKVGKVEIS